MNDFSRNTVLTVTGRSGSGKSTLVKMLKSLGAFDEAVSTTTRAPRAGEINEKDYFFVSMDEFDELWKRDRMIEKIDYNGNCYGVSASEFERIFESNKIPAVVVEPNGARQINDYCKRHGWNSINVFVDCDDALLFRRLLDRFKSDDKATVESYANRLLLVINDERAWKTALNYDLVIDKFDADTQARVIKRVLESCGRKEIDIDFGM